MKVVQTLASAIVGIAAFADPASAQQTPVRDASPASDEQTQQPTEPETRAANGDIVVTGSRIARAAIDLPTPVSVIGAEALRQTGTSDVGRLLAKQPALNFQGTLQASQNNGPTGAPGDTSGLTLANLRGLGTTRTLTLVDGRRQVGSDPGNTAFDLGSINPALIERIEVLTGGASAVYGSDAVSGVVNIITRDIDGVEFELKGSHSLDGSFGRTFGASIAAGQKFASGRGRFALDASWDESKAVQARDIKEHQDYNLLINPANKTASDGIPDFLIRPGYVADQVVTGGQIGLAGDTGTLGVIAFDAAGAPFKLPPRVLNGGSAIFGTFATPCDTCFKQDDYYTLSPEFKRKHIGGRVSFDILDGDSFTSTLYARGSYTTRDAMGNGQPLLLFGRPLNVRDNPYFDPTIRAQLLAEGKTTVSLTKAFQGLGTRESQTRRKTQQYDFGARGTIHTGFADLKYDAYYDYGRTDVDYIATRRFWAANVTAALDSVRDPADGQIKCRVSVPALQPAGYVAPAIIGGPCVPINPFGITTVTDAARKFLTLTPVSKGWLTQDVAGATFSTDTSKFLTFWGGGALGLAAGYEYRKEGSHFRSDNALKFALTTQAGNQVDADGGFDVSEFYVEASAPLIRDKPFARLLSIEGAFRTADYSHAGRANAWKVAGIWSPIDGLRLRGTVSRAVRAPNITEAFQPLQVSTAFTGDPCATAVINTTAQRRANCTALGVPANFVGNSISVPLITQGNRNLSPETAKTFTVGTVITPSFLPKFSLTVDYYKINIKDAISFLTIGQIASSCVDSTGGPDLNFCNLITRQTDRNSPQYFFIIGGQSTYVNAAKRVDEGVDFAARYRFDLGNGRLSTDINGTRLIKRLNYPYQSNPTQVTYQHGRFGNPRWKINGTVTYDTGPYTVSLTGRYFSKQSLIDRSPGANLELYDLQYAPATYYQDVYLERRFGPDKKWAFNLGATNVFNKRLPIGATLFGSLGAGSAYESLGVVVFSGIRGKF